MSDLIVTPDDTPRTGTPLTLSGKKISLEEVTIRIEKAKPPNVVTLPRRSYPVPEKQRIVPVDTAGLKTFPIEEDHAGSAFFAPIGSDLPTGVPIPAKKPVTTPCIWPTPITATLPAIRDAALYNIKYLAEAQGMNSTRIISLLQDRRGNLWFGTHAGGVSRYDGERFMHFTTAQGLPSNIITSIKEDRQGNIWFGTFSEGVSMFDGVSFTNYTTANGLSDNEINTMYIDSKGILWLGSEGGGLSKFDGKHFTHFTTREGLSSNTVLAIQEDRKGNLWVGTRGGGACKFDGKHFTHFNDREGLGSNTVQVILEDHKGNLWFGTGDNGLRMFDGKSFTHLSFSEGLSDNSVLSLLEDGMGNLWIGTESGGINLYDGQRVTHFTMREGLSDNTIVAMLEDTEGRLWLGTRDGGANIFDRKSFVHFMGLSSLNGDNVRCIFEDSKGNFWFGTWGGGVIKYDGDRLYQYSYEEGLRDNTVWDIQEDKDGNLWFGTQNAGLCKFDGQNFTHFEKTQDASNFTIWSLLIDKSDNLWLGTNGSGVFKYDGKTFVNYSIEEGFNGNRIWSIFEDRSGNIWFGTWGGGVSVFDGERFTYYTQKEGLISNDVWSIAEDQRGHLWFGTYGSGVSVFDGESFSHLTMKDGLPNEIISSIVVDNGGNIWLGTEKGLAKVMVENNQALKPQGSYPDKKLYKILNFSRFDGLKARDFNVHSTLLDSRNQIWWGTGKGAITLDMNNFDTTRYVPSVYLNNIDIDGQFVDFHNLNNHNEKIRSFTRVKPFLNYPSNLELPHETNHLTFHFSTMKGGSSHNVLYSYKMTGLNEDWSPPSPEAKADYQNIPFGEHTFVVRVKTANSKWSKPFEYPFTIYPPWWRTWWAYLFYVVTGSSFLAGYIRRLRKQIKEKQKQLEREQSLNLQLTNLNEANQRFVPRGFLEILGKNSITDLKLGEQIQAKMTILFADIRAYTTLSETMSPEENFKFINAYLGRVGPIIEKHGGFINQYYGDGLMALFLKEHKAALQASIEMQQVIQRYNQERLKKGRLAIRIGIGLNTGKLMLGIIGDHKRYDSGVISDAVNTASRMEGLTKFFGSSIIVSEKTVRELKRKKILQKEGHNYRFLGKVKVKGKEQALEIYDFFDGDPQYICQLKAETKEVFEKAIYCYFERKFGKAADGFKWVLEKHTEDLAAKYYFDKSILYITAGVSKDWSGIEEMVLK